ncbi:MAG: glycerate kinase [Paludibacter sp.]|nr:glycerate kinase [Paludibacter sp.]
MDRNSIAEQIFLAGVAGVLPDQLIRSQVKLNGNILSVAGNNYDLSSIKNIYVIGAGKASALMASEMESILGKRITKGHIVVKYGHGCDLKFITITEAGHPLPDANGVAAAGQILEIAQSADERDLVICLISGGASSLLADFPEGSGLEDLQLANELLVKSGAGIKEINTVRKHLSHIKGGQLARAIYPAKAVSLILSDVVGDPLDVIASGPTCYDNSTFAGAFAVIKKYGLGNKFPKTMMRHLQDGIAGWLPETPKAGDKVFENIKNLITGSNSIALTASASKAQSLGFTPYVITDALEEDYTEVAAYILMTIEKFRNYHKEQPLCLLFGGEPTVKVMGNGLGGRNQHLALYCALQLRGTKGITLLCAGTDGSDGPTDAAGAVVDGETAAKAKSAGIDAQEYLNSADSYHFFQQMGGHIVTGSTKTNVMDMMIVLIE